MWLMLSCTTVTFPEGFPAAVGQHLQTRLRNWDRTRRLRLLFLLLSSNSVVLCCANNAHPMGVLSDKATVLINIADMWLTPVPLSLSHLVF